MTVTVGTPPRWLDAGEEQTWRDLLRVCARVVVRLDDELQTTHGLGLADYEVLVGLSESPGGSLRMAELAGRLRLSPSGLTRRIDRLVRRGLVVRRACRSDGRGSFAVLTDAGRELLADAAPTHVAGVRAYVVDPLSGPAWQLLAAGLTDVEGALEMARRPQPGSDPVTTGRLSAAQPLVPPATETA